MKISNILKNIYYFNFLKCVFILLRWKTFELNYCCEDKNKMLVMHLWNQFFDVFINSRNIDN